MIQVISNCKHCKLEFKYKIKGIIHKKRTVCNACVWKIKGEYNKKYLIKMPSKMCTVCYKKVYKGMTVHKVCEQRLFNSNAPVTRQWHKEHLNKGVVDDEACVFV